MPREIRGGLDYPFAMSTGLGINTLVAVTITPLTNYSSVPTHGQDASGGREIRLDIS